MEPDPQALAEVNKRGGLAVSWGAALKVSNLDGHHSRMTSVPEPRPHVLGLPGGERMPLTGGKSGGTESPLVRAVSPPGQEPRSHQVAERDEWPQRFPVLYVGGDIVDASACPRPLLVFSPLPGGPPLTLALTAFLRVLPSHEEETYRFRERLVR